MGEYKQYIQETLLEHVAQVIRETAQLSITEHLLYIAMLPRLEEVAELPNT